MNALSTKPILLTKTVLMAGIAAWMSIAVFNNATDPGTNRYLLGLMLEMTLLQDEPNGLGAGLLWRAWSSEVAPPLLWGIVAVQIAIALYLWRGALTFGAAAFSGDRVALEDARRTCIRALTAFMTLWIFFLCGGLWFGYWMKQGAVQMVHMTLLIMSVLFIGFMADRRGERPEEA
ncbi:DUF2165 family protein [Salinarimonas ramus]|uniref:DUF2165 domain-containing protein n=1 Tax=Salinarimonas ramus TaxID=690164 RepID=A0A917QCC9_9HYPH|nr:DUF2165 family protein [Salinarimonas ramus]GGK43131.1 hypothetical protein GCM10011322_32880 [Salinarimonas ramus]